MEFVMDLESLEEALDEILPAGYSIETDSHGQIIIYTGLTQEDDGELSPFDSEEDEEIDDDHNSFEDDPEDEE